MPMIRPGLCGPLLSLTLPAGAEVLHTDPLTISAPRTPSAWLESPLPVSVIEPAEGSRNLEQLLAPVPGLLAFNSYNQAQGLRLSLRGFGARAGFGVRGLRVLVDGVPLTMPDGQTELDGIDPALIERIEVLRGPAAMLYGNAAGGVLLIETRQPGPGGRLDVSAGSLGQRRLSAELGGASGDFSGLLAAQAADQDGYREHAEARLRNTTLKGRWQTEGGRLDLHLNVLDNQARDPGALDQAQLDISRRQASPPALTFRGDESVRQQRLGLNWQSEQWQLRAHVGRRDFENRLPFRNGGQGSFERDFAGLGGLYWLDHRLFGLDQRLSLGAELEGQRDLRSRHDNLFGERGARTLRQREEASSAALFAQNEMQLGERWLASAGLRHDRLRLAVADRWLVDGEQSGSRRLEETHYSAALGYRLNEHHQLYARLASSFESPTINELANPAGGGFNPALGPAQARSRELGLKGDLPGLRYELALFRIDLDDELLPYSLPGQSGRTYYRNAGQSRREGVEASLDWQLAEHWRLVAAWIWSDFRFREAEYAGNALPGVPRQRLFGELHYSRDFWYASLSLDARSHSYAEDASQVRVPGNARVNLRLGWRLERGDQYLEPYLGVDNLFDRDYFDNLRLNDANGRYFEPGPGRTLLAGIRVGF